MSRRKQLHPKPLLKNSVTKAGFVEDFKISGAIQAHGEKSNFQDLSSCKPLSNTFTFTKCDAEKHNSEIPEEQNIKNKLEAEHSNFMLNAFLTSGAKLIIETSDVKSKNVEIITETFSKTEIDRSRSPSAEFLQHIKIFMCQPCGIGFSTLSTLEAHQTYYCSHRTENEIEEKTVSSVEPELASIGEPSSKSTKTGKQYVCTQCSYSADKKVSLNRHMRMHQSSPVPTSNILNGNENSSQLTDRYCSECDIHFSNIKTYRAHKQHYCHSRRLENIQAISTNHGSERKSPIMESIKSTPVSNHFLALPTNPILIIPYPLLRMASILPRSIASLVEEKEKSISTCFSYENGSLKRLSTAVNINKQNSFESTNYESVSTNDEDIPLVVINDSDRKTLLSVMNKECLENNKKIGEPIPLDLSYRKPTFELIDDLKENLVVGNDKNTNENISYSPPLVNLDLTLSHSQEKSSYSETFQAARRKVSNERITSPILRKHSLANTTELTGSKDAIFMQGTRSNTISTTLNSANSLNSTMKSGSPQIYVKQGVSKCKECNIVFCKYENYLAHKQHYCSARNKEEKDAILISDCQPDTFSQTKSYQQLICAACGIKYTSLDNLRAHQSFYCPKGIDLEHTAGTNQCDKCKSIHDHGKCTLNKSSYKCPVCDVISDNFVESKKHLETHGSVKAFKCIVCNYKGNTLRGMRTHIRMHFDKEASDFKEEKYMLCIMEDEIVESKLEEVTSKEPQKEVFKCDSCSYSSSFKRNLLRHAHLLHLQTFDGLNSSKLEEEKKNSFNKCGNFNDTTEERLFLKTEFVEETDIIMQNKDNNNLKVDMKENINNESSLSTLPTTPPLAANDFSLKYCHICDIRFKYLSSYVAHKKFYCKRSKDESEISSMELKQLSPTLTTDKDHLEAVL